MSEPVPMIDGWPINDGMNSLIVTVNAARLIGEVVAFI